MLIQAQNINALRGIRDSRNGLRINHLFFADDALMFVRNKKNDVDCFVNFIRNFASTSGQEINYDKSMVLFSPNTPSDQKSYFGDLLGMKIVEKHDKYLSLPISIGNKKKEAFFEITNRFSCRINSWSKRLLSY